MQTRHVRLLARTAAIGATVLALAGCPEDAADITEIRATSLDFDVAPLAGVSFLGGAMSIERSLLVAFDTTVDDAFVRELARCTGDDVCTATNYGFLFFDGDTGDPEWVFDAPAHRAIDPRAPLVSATAAVGTNGTGLFIDPPTNEGLNHYFFIISGSLSNLPVSTTFTVALVRLGTQVKGELDQAAALQGDPITQPDSLIILNPNPLGDPNVVLGVGSATVNRGDTVFAQAGANPLIIGHASSNATGTSDFGIDLRCDTSGGTPVFWCTDASPSATALSDSMMFGRNDGVAYGLPRYNYVVLYEGIVTPTDLTPVVARWQTGQDMDLAGNIVNNGAAPFPPGALTDPQLINLPGGAGRPDSITFETTEVKELTGGAVWQIWVYNRDESPPTMSPVTATHERIAAIQIRDPLTGEVISEQDSLLETRTSSSFVGQSSVSLVFGGETVVSKVRHRLSISDAIGGAGAEPGFFTDIFLSQEAAPGAATPADARPVFFQYTDQNGTPTNFFDDASTGGTASFGAFDIADATASTIFLESSLVQSSGLGGVRLASGEEEISVDIRNLPLPPVGFFYAGWAVGVGILVEETAIPMGPLTTVPPDTVSLFDADIDQSPDGITATGIRFANARVLLPVNSIVDAQGSSILNTFFLTLEPKLGNNTIIGPTPLEIGGLPIATITARQAGN